jgi:hypothetical protein
MGDEIVWCCSGMQDLFTQYGKRGFGALMSTQLGITRFLLQFRVVDDGNERKISGPGDLAISLIGQMGLTFCPSCGVHLEKYYREQLDRFPLREPI